MRIRFGDYTLDEATLELSLAGEPISMEPQVFRVLCYLAEHRDRVVSKEELLDNVWGDRFVSESALSTRIKHARRAVGDDGRSQHTIKTFHGTGFRFVAPIDEAVKDDTSVTVSRIRTQIPTALASLIGRDEDLETISTCLLYTSPSPRDA